MHKYIYTGALLIFTLVLSACDTDKSGISAEAVEPKPQVIETTAEKPAQQPAETIKPENSVSAISVIFEEVETDNEPFITRMIFSEKFIRIDDGPESEDYVLYDREKKRIFSIVAENESILVVDPSAEAGPSPENLTITTQLIDDPGIPDIAGKKPRYTQYSANDQLCFHVVAADNFLPEVTQMLREYQMVLMAQQQQILSNTPEELQTSCFLANYVYAPVQFLEHGFPVQQWDTTGYRRSLLSFKENVVVDKVNFALPSNYGFFSMGLNTDSPL